MAQRSITLRQVLGPLDFDDGVRTYRLSPGVLITTMLSVNNCSAAPGLERLIRRTTRDDRLAPCGAARDRAGEHVRARQPLVPGAASHHRDPLAVRRPVDQYDFTRVVSAHSRALAARRRRARGAPVLRSTTFGCARALTPRRSPGSVGDGVPDRVTSVVALAEVGDKDAATLARARRALPEAVADRARHPATMILNHARGGANGRPLRSYFTPDVPALGARHPRSSRSPRGR